MTFPFRCWRPVRAKPSSAVYEHMCAMIGRLEMERLQRSGSLTRADRRGEHPHRHLATFHGTLQADAYAGLIGCMIVAAFGKLLARRMCDRKFFDPSSTRFSYCDRGPLSESVSYMPLRMRFAVARPMNGSAYPKADRGPYESRCTNGSKHHSRSCVVSRRWPRRSAMRSGAGLPWLC